MENSKNNEQYDLDTVMLVDDDELATYIGKKIIERTGLVNEIKIFDNGLKAINFLKDHINNPESLPQLILLDINMPIMDGWGFLEEFMKIKHQLKKKIIIYILSSSVNPDDFNRVTRINEVSDFIIKPITKSVFEKIVNDLKVNRPSNSAKT